LTSSKYKKVVSRKEPQVEVSIKARDKDGTPKYAVQVSNFDREDFKEIDPPLRWKKIRVNKQCSLIFARATKDTNFTTNGELVCKLVFSDNRVKGGLRLRPGDITERDFKRLNKILREEFRSPYDIKK
jgi:hypothetical protein